jgi:hypothetical protein
MTNSEKAALTLDEAEQIIEEGLEPMQAVGLILDSRAELADALMAMTNVAIDATNGRPLRDEDGNAVALNEGTVRRATAKLLRETMLDTTIALESLGAPKGTFETAQEAILDKLAVTA